jgi:glycolate oxidase iron-sulfur subunit
MSSPLPVIQIDSRAYERGLSCVHCGLCLAACPTYLQTRHEADSPRGRIQLVRGLAEKTVAPTESVRRHLDLCLDCRACETACPSDVVYHELIEEYRLRAGRQFPPSMSQRMLRWFCLHIVARPLRLRAALLPVRLLRPMLLPPGRWWPGKLPERVRGGQKATVGLLAGCVSSVLFESVNRKSAELLARAGANVIAPADQVCCGAIHYHNGDDATARQFARRNIDAFGTNLDVLATTAGGCGAMLREYGQLLRDDPQYAQRAAKFAAKVRDVTEVLLDLGLPPMRGTGPITVTYQDSCHLAHAQKVRAAPRQLLSQIPGLTLVPLPESDLCCGSAGTYFLTQPQMARSLAERKLKNIAATGAGICVTGNAGCALHLRRQARALRQPVDFPNPVELLHAAMRDA